jgi:hypothetical protein
MNITLSLDERLVKKIRKFAEDRGTTLTELAREYLEKLVAESAAAGRQRPESGALERAFQEIHVKMGKKTWSRADLQERR